MSAVAALKVFSRNARSLLEYLGLHEDELYDIVRPEAEASRYVKGAGSAAAFFILGPFGVGAAGRLRHGQVIAPGDPPLTFTSALVPQTPAAHAEAWGV